MSAQLTRITMKRLHGLSMLPGISKGTSYNKSQDISIAIYRNINQNFSNTSSLTIKKGMLYTVEEAITLFSRQFKIHITRNHEPWEKSRNENMVDNLNLSRNLNQSTYKHLFHNSMLLILIQWIYFYNQINIKNIFLQKEQAVYKTSE